MKKQEEMEKPLKGLYENSEEVQEIMGRTPDWLCRWGIPIIIMLATAVFLICTSVRLSEAEEIRLQVCHPYAPEAVRAALSGRIASPGHGNGRRIQAGDSIAFIGNGLSGYWAVAPITGRMEAHRCLAEGALVAEGDTICWIVPDRTDRPVFYGRVRMNDTCLLTEGQRLDMVVEPSSRESGVHVAGVVTYMASFPDTDGRSYFEVTPSEDIPCMQSYGSVRCCLREKEVSLMQKMLSTLGRPGR